MKGNASANKKRNKTAKYRAAKKARVVRRKKLSPHGRKSGKWG